MPVSKKARRAAAADDESIRSLQQVLFGTSSQASSCDIVSRLRKGPREMPIAPSTYAMKQAAKARFDLVKRTRTLALNDGTTYEWVFCCPNRLVMEMVADSPSLQQA